MRRISLILLVWLTAFPALAQSGPTYAVRDETTRLAVAVLGRICLMNLGDSNAILTAASPTGEFGFADVTVDVADTFLKGRDGFVRVLRRPGLGAITLVSGADGICTVWSEYADVNALQRHLMAMIEKGGLKGGAQILPLDSRDEDGQRLTDYYVMPLDWFARDLGKRFGEDGSQPLPLVTSVSNPGRRPMEAMLSVSRVMKR